MHVREKDGRWQHHKIGSHKTNFCFAQSFRNVHTLRYGLKSGLMRSASTGISPLLRLRSPEVAVKALLSGETAFTNLTALQPSLLLLLSIGKVILLCHHIGTHPARLTRPMPCQSRLGKKGASQWAFVAYSVFLRTTVRHQIHHLSPKFAWSRPSRSRTPQSGLSKTPHHTPKVLLKFLWFQGVSFCCGPTYPLLFSESRFPYLCFPFHFRPKASTPKVQLV